MPSVNEVSAEWYGRSFVRTHFSGHAVSQNVLARTKLIMGGVELELTFPFSIPSDIDFYIDAIAFDVFA